MASQETVILTTSWKNVGFWRLVIGIIMTLLGLYICFNPMVSIVVLALYIGIAFIFSGLAYTVASFSFESGWDLLVGLLDIFIGLILVANIGMTAVSLPMILAVWSLAVGIIQIVGAFKLRKANLSWCWSLFAGICGMLFAFLILIYPVVGIVTITTLIGLYLVLYGAFSIGEFIYFSGKSTKASN